MGATIGVKYTQNFLKEGDSMLKGCTKKVIFVKLTDNSIYEEAYFVMRPGVTSVCTERDFLSEAKRIIAGGYTQRVTPAKHGRIRRFVFAALMFGGGMAFYAAARVVAEMLTKIQV